MTRWPDVLASAGTCDKSGCDRRRWRLSSQTRGCSNYCQPHTCTLPTERPGTSGFGTMCRAKKSSSELGCPTHLRPTQATSRAAAAEERRWREHVAWSTLLCSEDGCAQPRHADLAVCVRHAGLCGRPDCGFMRLEDSDCCARHQVCLHGECERPALILCVSRGFGGSEMEVQGSTRFCAAHRACGASRLVEDRGEGCWEFCATPVGIGEAACREHRCAVDGCRERKPVWHDRPSAYCLLHTCATGGCKKPTPNTAADRKHRFCKKHTCKRDGCTRGTVREDRRFPFCEGHTCILPECSVEVCGELPYCVQHFARMAHGDFEAARPPSPRSVSASSRWTDEDAAGRGRDPAPRPVMAELQGLMATMDPAEAEQLGNILLNLNLGPPDPRPERRHERRQRRREDSVAPRNSPPIPDPQNLDHLFRFLAARRGGGR